MNQITNEKKPGYYIKRIKGYFKSARLESIIVTTNFLLLGLYYSAGNLQLKDSFVGFFSISLLVIAGSWQNYVFDIEVDKKAGKNIEFFKNITPREMLLSSIIIGIIALVILYSVDFYSFILGVIEFIIFLFYAAPPLRFKNRYFFDFIANGLVFGTLPFLIGFRLSNTVVQYNYLALGFILGLLAGSYYLFISSFEIETDNKAGVKNTCTFLGSNTINVAIVIFFISMISFLLFFSISNIIILVGFLITAPFVVFIRFAKKSHVLLFLVSLIFLFWNGSISLLLSIFTMSILSIVLFLIIIVIIATAVYTWIVTEV